MKLGSLLAIVLFALIAVLHILRLAYSVPVMAGGVIIPMWASVLGVLVPAAVAVLLWREGRTIGAAE